MLTLDQYNFLNKIKMETDGIAGPPRFFSFLSLWKNLKKNGFIEEKRRKDRYWVFVITFPGRVALAAYEEQQC